MVNFNDLGKVVFQVLQTVGKSAPPGASKGSRTGARRASQTLDSRGVSIEETYDAVHMGEKLTLIDVRTPREFAPGHIKESINMPEAELAARASKEIRKGYSPVTVSTDIAQSARACEILVSLGYDDANWLRESIADWPKK